MRSVSIFAAVLCSTVLVFGAAQTYAQADCEMTCKNGAAQTLPLIPTQGACQLACNTFCDETENSSVLSCYYDGVNVKGNCDVECKTGETQHIMLEAPNATEGACLAACNTFCGTNANVFSCWFKGQSLKGNCDALCKDETETHVSTADEDACLDECDSFCGANTEVLSCHFKGQNIKGGCYDSSELPFEGALVEGTHWESPQGCAGPATGARVTNWNNDRDINDWEMHVTSFKLLDGQLQEDNRTVIADASGVDVALDRTVTFEFWQYCVEWNSMGWDIEWRCPPPGASAQATVVEDVPGYYWRFDYPLHIGGNQYSHRFTFANDDVGTPMVISGLTVLASPVPIAHDHLAEIDLAGGVFYPDFDLPAEWTTDIVTTGSYVGGYIYFKYDIKVKGAPDPVAGGYGGHPITQVQCAANCKDGSVSAGAYGRKECWNYCLDTCNGIQQVDRCNFEGEQIITNIPAVTEWGMVVMVLLVVAAGTVVIRRARAVRA